MKIAYFDCFSGISGDMCLGAFVDTGLDIGKIQIALRKLAIKDWRLASKKVTRCGISSTKVDVILPDDKEPGKTGRKWRDIQKIIHSSRFSSPIKKKGLEIFRRLFEAEAKVHGEPFEEAHLHELGAVDCLVDIFGVLIGIELLKIEKVYVSKVNLGSGTVITSHGVLPVPAPATSELLKGFSVYSSDIPFELATPTGAAILNGLEAECAPMPLMNIDKIGYGAGNRDIPDMPNVLRLITGEQLDWSMGSLPENVVTVIETNIDDMNPQIYEDVLEKLFAAGALDVSLENILMKKGRPAIKLSIIAEEKDFRLLTKILFENTTTIGIRFYNARRITLTREIKPVKTKLGKVKIKISRLGDKVLNISPEYEDLKTLSKKVSLPIKKLNEMLITEIKRQDI
jgi:uncharacterized protein (TIGR00299 family) protein